VLVFSRTQNPAPSPQNPAPSPQNLDVMKRIFYILLFVGAFLFYWNTARYIENRTEAEDAYEYAMMVETQAWMPQKERQPALECRTAEQEILNVEGTEDGRQRTEDGGLRAEDRGRPQHPSPSPQNLAPSTQHPWLYHPHHLLYGSVMKAGYSGVKCLGWNGRAFDFLMLMSSLSAAGTLFLFFQFCYRRFSLRPVSSLLATGLLGVSYGFWRYAAEAEIVLPASLFGLAALYCATGLDNRSRRTVALAALLSVLAVLMHIMNAVVVFVAIPSFYLLRRRGGATAAHLLFCAAGVGAVVFLLHSAGLIHEGGDGGFLPLGFGSFVKATIALGQCLVSGDFMMGFASVRAFLSKLFASRMLGEEFYLAARLARPVVLFSVLTFLMLGGLVLGAVRRAGWVWKNWIHDRARIHLPEGLPAIAVVAVWFLGYAGLLLFVEPGNPELWVMGLIPFWLLICGLILLPLTVDNRLWLPLAILLLLLLHNAVAGIGVLGDPEKDYQYQKAKWILENVTSKDRVLTAGNPVFERYLRYHVEGDVIYLLEAGPSPDELVASPGRVFVLGDVFDPIESMQTRFSSKMDEIAVYAEKIRPKTVLVAENEFGGVYEFRKASSGGSKDL